MCVALKTSFGLLPRADFCRTDDEQVGLKGHRQGTLDFRQERELPLTLREPLRAFLCPPGQATRWGARGGGWPEAALEQEGPGSASSFPPGLSPSGSGPPSSVRWR